MRKTPEARVYMVRVCVPDENFDGDSVSSSMMYGPYTRTEAEKIHEAVSRIEGVQVVIHLLIRSTLGYIYGEAKREAELLLGE